MSIVIKVLRFYDDEIEDHMQRYVIWEKAKTCG